MQTKGINWLKIIILSFIFLFIVACSSKISSMKPVLPPASVRSLEPMGFTIQAGAFAKVENAVRLTERLKMHRLDATYYVAEDRFFKVRFGNFSSKEVAREKAQSLKDAGVIEDFYIVHPEDYAAVKKKQYGRSYLREAIVKTASDFIGVPYLWGGNSPDTGFDCSGLTMTVYQLNGLNLPRHSAGQFEAGNLVGSDSLQKGDLIFFAIKEKNKVSHVGIYIGNGRFIHAPSRGKKIRIDSLASNYYIKRFIGGKSYI